MRTNLFRLFDTNGYLETSKHIFRVERRLNSLMLVIQSLDEKMSCSFELTEDKVDDLFYAINEYYGTYFINSPDHHKKRRIALASGKSYKFYLRTFDDCDERELIYSDNNNYIVITLTRQDQSSLYIYLFSHIMKINREVKSNEYLKSKEFLNLQTWYEKRKFRTIKQLHEEEKLLKKKKDYEYRKLLYDL